MRIGLSTPVVLQVPGVASAWEATGTAADLAHIAETADRLGYEYLTCSEHIGVPTAEAERRGAVYWDPLATLSFLAAHTAQIRLVTAVLVLAYHHPLEIAKRYGTLDVLSGGRLTLGVGIGSLAEEFELIGAQWEQRAARADDAIRALRASLPTATPSYEGPFYRFGGMTVTPHACQSQVPIWVGGRSAASLRRAVELADGWMPFGVGGQEIRQLLGKVEVPSGFEVVLSTGSAIDPGGDPDCARRVLRGLADSGATVITCVIAADSAEHYCEQLTALKEIADTMFVAGTGES